MAIKSRPAKIFIRVLCAALALILLIAASYVIYVFCSYYRLDDDLALDINGESDSSVFVGEELKIMTYNIGFGAYSADYSFFMDGGEHARAYSKEAVLKNTQGAIDTLSALSPDIMFLQEVDIDGTRSYHVDQSELFADAFPEYDRVFTQNYDSPYFIYPFNQPIGANRSGTLTLSAFNITSATRRSLPIEDSLYKLFDLDRAYTVSIIPASNGKKLVLFNVHLSAYTSDGTIADEQLRMLAEDMEKEYKKGNYVIAAGDFNKDLLGDSSKFFERTEGEFTWAKPLDLSLLPSGFTCHSGTNAPTCRNADSAYRADGTDFVLSVDGFLLSDNIELVSSETVSTGFAFSDHDPVLARIILLDE